MLLERKEMNFRASELRMLLVLAKLARNYLKLIDFVPLLVPHCAVQLIVQMGLSQDID